MVQRILLITCSLLIIGSNGFAQEIKQESEKYVKAEEFPAFALDQLNGLSNLRNVRYIKEFDGSSISYEAKFRLKKQRLSVEFSRTGILEDIEVLIRENELPKKLRSALIEQLDNRYKKYKLTRIQKQFKPRSGKESSALRNFVDQKFGHFKIQYELEVRVVEKKTNKLGSYELLINKEGEIIQKRRIEKVIDDNVIY